MRKFLIGAAGSFLVLGNVFAVPPDIEAIYLEALQKTFGLGSEVDEPGSFALLQKAAGLGDPRALAWKARKTFKGEWGFSKDPEQAKNLFQSIEGDLQKMAEKNLSDAKRALAIAWGVLFPVEKGKEAFAILQEISNENSPLNWGTLAWAYENGIGVETNTSKAFLWYQKAGNGGNINALAEMVLCYEE